MAVSFEREPRRGRVAALTKWVVVLDGKRQNLAVLRFMGQLHLDVLGLLLSRTFPDAATPEECPGLAAYLEGGQWRKDRASKLPTLYGHEA